jgi:hypothetical protein
MAKKFEVSITDEEYRAFNLIVEDADEWVDNLVRNKVRKCLIYVAEEVAQDLDNLLDPADKSTIEALMVQNGDVLKKPQDYSDVVKREIVKLTKMKTRKERDAEELANLQP